MISCITHGEDETRALGAAVAELAQPGDTLILGGDLGAGKTRFTQGLAKALGIAETVTSPTFNLVRSYEGGRMRLHHADLYRTEDEAEAVDLILSELEPSGSVCVIEWGEPAATLLPEGHLEVRLRLGDGDDDRVIEVSAVGPAWAGRATALQEALRTWGDHS